MIDLNNIASRALNLALKRGKKKSYFDFSLTAFKQEVNECYAASDDEPSEHLNSYSARAEELIDVLISCLTELKIRGVNVEKLLKAKMNYNSSRPKKASKSKEDTIVTVLVGSSKFKDDFVRCSKELALQGKIVLTKEVFLHQEDGYSEDEINRLYQLHLKKIEMCDEVFVVNKGGYIGESTAACISYARIKGKRIIYMENEKRGI